MAARLRLEQVKLQEFRFEDMVFTQGDSKSWESPKEADIV